MEIPGGVLAAGIPAKVKKELAGNSQRWVETAAPRVPVQAAALHALKHSPEAPARVPVVVVLEDAHGDAQLSAGGEQPAAAGVELHRDASAPHALVGNDVAVKTRGVARGDADAVPAGEERGRGVQ